MDGLLHFVDVVSNWIWGIPMLIVMVGGSLLMTFYLKFFQFRHLPYILKETFGRMFGKKSGGSGTITAFQAAVSALGATIGSGNIVGVSIAIGLGGPGAAFWMICVALFACALKYSEITLGIKYRLTNEIGEYVGGPMYYLKKVKWLPWLGTFYALMFILELAPSVGNQAASVVDIAGVINIPRSVSIIAIAVIILVIVYGGVKSVGVAMEKVVPLMGIVYISCSLVILLINYKELPDAIGIIFKSAFSGTAATGGFIGASVAQAMRWGLARGVSSNDAGNGQSAIVHSAAVTDHPARQGIWGVFEVIVDTILICNASALIIVVTGVWQIGGDVKVSTLAALAFQKYLGQSIGGILMTLCLAMFCLTTIIVLFYYGEKLTEAILGTKASKYTKYFYLFFVLFGCYGGVSLMVRFLDIMYALIIIPNVIGLFCLRKDIKEITDDFFKNRENYDKIRSESEKK